MKTLAFALVLALAGLVGCAGDAGFTGDDTCAVSIAYTPTQPLAGPDSEVRLISTVTNTSGTLSYSWNVMRGSTIVPYDDALSNHSEITFLATDAGTYDVTLDIAPSSGGFCPQGSAHVNVLQDITAMDARLHITPPATVTAPLVDRAIQIHNATDYDMGPVVLEAGKLTTGQVRNGATGVAAYLRFIPQGMAGAVVETFADATGAYSVRILDQPHDVIVVPAVAGLAPKKIIGYLPTHTVLAVGPGQGLGGSVHQGATPIAGAKVQLTIDDVPTTLTTTAGDGSFTVLGVPVAGAVVKVEVTPVAGSGLARLEATGMFDVQAPINVNYSAQTLRNLNGTPVRRGGSAQTNKKVVIVGTVGAAGTVTAGAGATATGYIRITTTTDAGGNLPSVLAPAGPLFAVTTVAQGDLAVGACDLTSGVPAQIDAPAMTAFATDASGVGEMLDGATLDLVPTGSLALAGASSLHFIANGVGRVTGLVPTGGAFDVRWSDPAGRRAPRVDANVTQILGSYLLPAAIYITGDLTVTGSSNPVVGASVQILCAACTGLERNRPIAEVATDPHGTFTVAVPDPGAM